MFPATADRFLRLGASGEPRFLRHTGLAITASLLAAFSFYLTTTLHHDVSGYLISTGRMLDGAWPYRDIVDVNPPLAFYLTIPPVAAARLTGLSAESCFIAYLFSLIAISLLLTRYVLARTTSTPVDRSSMLIAALVTLVLLPIGVLGQREHLMLILTLPYIFLFSARLRGDRLSPSLAIVIGILASLGFNLKPYFLLVPACFEIYAVVARRSLFAWLRPEVLSLGVGVVTYGAFLAIVHPEYIEIIVPYGLLVYGAYSAPWSAVLLQQSVVAIALSLSLYGWCRSSGPIGRPVDAFSIAATCFLVTYIIQQKGWAYQLAPATGATCLTISAILIELRGAEIGHAVRQKLMTIFSAALLVAVVALSVAGGPYRNVFAERLVPDVERYASGGTIYVFTTYMSVVYPLVNETHVGWSSRFPAQWLLPGALRRLSDPTTLEPQTKARLLEIERYAVDAVIEDLYRDPPNLIIVDKSHGYFGRMGFDFLEYFGREPRFEQFWEPYRKVKETTVKNRRFEFWCRPDRSPRCAADLR